MSERKPVIQVRELESLRAELERQADSLAPRWNADPEEVQRSVARLVLTLVEFIRQLLERQAIRRMEAETLTADETEAIGADHLGEALQFRGSSREVRSGFRWFVTVTRVVTLPLCDAERRRGGHHDCTDRRNRT